MTQTIEQLQARKGKGSEMKEYNEQVVETLDDAGCIIANKNIKIDYLNQKIAAAEARIAELEAENEQLSLYKQLADEYGLSVFADLAELQKQRDELLAALENMISPMASEAEGALDELAEKVAKAKEAIASVKEKS